jgi:hypothetical protein
MRRHRIAALLAVAAAAGCRPGGGADDAGAPGTCAFQVALDVQGPLGDYRQVGAAGDARLVLGFQGFKFVMARGRFDAPPAVQSGAVLVRLDGRALRSQPFGALRLGGDGSGDAGTGQVSDPFPVFFNDDPLPTLVDTGLDITLLVGDDRCGARAGGHVTLRYVPGCIQDADGGFVCTDGG